MQLPAFVRGKARSSATRSPRSSGTAAQTNDDLLALARQTARASPRPMSVVIVPMEPTNPCSARPLACGFRVAKVLNYMSLDAFDPASGPLVPHPSGCPAAAGTPRTLSRRMPKRPAPLRRNQQRRCLF